MGFSVGIAESLVKVIVTSLPRKPLLDDAEMEHSRTGALSGPLLLGALFQEFDQVTAQTWTYLRNHPAAQLLCSIGKHHVSVFVAGRAAAIRARRPLLIKRTAVNSTLRIAYWIFHDWSDLLPTLRKMASLEKWSEHHNRAALMLVVMELLGKRVWSEWKLAHLFCNKSIAPQLFLNKFVCACPRRFARRGKVSAICEAIRDDEQERVLHAHCDLAAHEGQQDEIGLSMLQECGDKDLTSE